MSLIAELKQRKVFRVAAAYTIAAWVLLQVADVVLPALKLPDWTLTFTTILLLLGFPVVLIFAWSFELVRDRGNTPAAEIHDGRLAVLPFDNMTDDPAQAHFADGLVEDLLTRLQAIGWLNVISRQSAFAYRGRSVDIPTIARELGCRYIVEGSVRRIDDRMRVTAQLIDAGGDRHLWAERYDRRLIDAFQLQDEICDQVVAAIESRLAPGATTTDAEGQALGSGSPRARLFGTWWTLAAVTGLVGMALLLTWTWQQRSLERWAREEALPQLQALIAKDDSAGAFDLARSIEQVIPSDPQLRELSPMYSAPVRLTTDPVGATVFFRPYEGTDSDWRLIGEAPLDDVPVPIGIGLWRFEHVDHATTVRTLRNPGPELGNQGDPELIEEFKNVDFVVPLASAQSIPAGMVQVPATNLPVSLISNGDPVELPAYYIDRFEVTNREYKEFIDAGGYREAAYWQDLNFGDSAASDKEAITRFVDATGRPGPSTWESGMYPDGAGDSPVAGVSWFEAMAYAKFRGKDLPTGYHWYRAAYSANELLDSISSAVVRYSNFAGKAIAPVGLYQGIGPYGTYDMAGNVREWLWTELGDTRLIAGGAWNEPPYQYNQIDSADPWDRSAGNGFRCMRTVTGGPVGTVLRSPVTVTTTDFLALRPIDDAGYSVLEQQLRYSSSDLHPRVEKMASTNASWNRERISLATGYEEKQFNVQLFLPTGGHAPYQAIIYLPHAGNFRYAQSSDEFDPAEINLPLDFIPKSGRAFVVITFDGTFERRWPDSRFQSMTYADRFRLRQRHHRQDLGRALDYLATREDIDSTRLGALGISYGAQAMMPLLAVENRIGATVLVGGGVFMLPVPETEQPFNYLPRVSQPVLMLSGRWDIDVGPDAQEAMLRLLGTPPEQKQRILFDAGHGWLPQNQFVRAALDWYDTYLGSTH